MSEFKWTPRREQFCAEYIVDYNGTQAAIRAGYAAGSAAKTAYDLLRLPEIKSRVEQELKACIERTHITADRIRYELAKTSFSSMADYVSVQTDGTAYVDLSACTPEQLSAIQEMTVEEYTEGRGDDIRDVKRVKIKLYDKLRSLKLLGDHVDVQAFQERVEVSAGKSLAELMTETLQE